MQVRTIATALAVSSCLIASRLVAQATRSAADTSLLGMAYRAVEAKLPVGRRVVVVVDPLLKIPPGQENAVGLANRQFANAMALPVVTLDEVLTCRAPYDCSFKDNVVATVSLNIAARTPDTAIVEVATRYFLPPSKARLTPTFRWRAEALYEVKLAQRHGRWTASSVTPRSES